MTPAVTERMPLGIGVRGYRAGDPDTVVALFRYPAEQLLQPAPPLS